MWERSSTWETKRYAVLLPPNPERDGFCRDDALCATVALCHQQILIHVCRPVFGILSAIVSCRLPVVREVLRTLYIGGMFGIHCKIV